MICRDWHLDAEQAERFLTLSREIEARTYHHDYDTAPCKVTGSAYAWGQAWQLSINGAAKATLKRGNEVKYFGCQDHQCESLVMWMPDGTELD